MQSRPCAVCLAEAPRCRRLVAKGAVGPCRVEAAAPALDHHTRRFERVKNPAMEQFVSYGRKLVTV